MTAPFTTPERVPLSAAERMLAHLCALVAQLGTALDAMGNDATEALRLRSQRLLSLLQEEQRTLAEELQRFAANEREPLLRHAAALCTLTRRMDGYDLGFAGEEAAAGLVEQRQLLVLVAWQIAAAGSGSPAAGL